MPRASSDFGPYREAGKIIDQFLREKGHDRKWLADKIGANDRSIGHWIRGTSWPREPEYRLKMRGLGLDVVSINRVVCAVLDLTPNTDDEQELLEAYRAANEKQLAAVHVALFHRKKGTQ